jgi:hypothetical protein
VDCVIRWKHSACWDDLRPIGARIAADLEVRSLPFTPCHSGPVTVTVSCVASAQTFGRVSCRCGAVIGWLSGDRDATNLSYMGLGTARGRWLN